VIQCERAVAALSSAIAPPLHRGRVGPSRLMLAGWVMLGALTFIAIGFFVAAIARTEESGTAFINLVNLPMLVLSGVFFPVSSLRTSSGRWSEPCRWPTSPMRYDGRCSTRRQSTRRGSTSLCWWPG